MRTEQGRSSDRPRVTINQLVTISDLQDFKKELREEMLSAIRQIVHEQPKTPQKKWLKSWEVKKILGIAGNTLQTLRDNGTLPHSRIGRLIYYDPADIDQEIERRKAHGRNRSGQFIPTNSGARDGPVAKSDKPVKGRDRSAR